MSALVVKAPRSCYFMASATPAICGRLNDYAEAVADAITSEGGEVLKFMGDGILAISGERKSDEACAAALRAWGQASAAARAISSARAARGAALRLAIDPLRPRNSAIPGRSAVDL